MDFEENVVVRALLLRFLQKAKKKDVTKESFNFVTYTRTFVRIPKKNIFHFNNQFIFVKIALSLLPVILRIRRSRLARLDSCCKF